VRLIAPARRLATTASRQTGIWPFSACLRTYSSAKPRSRQQPTNGAAERPLFACLGLGQSFYAAHAGKGRILALVSLPIADGNIGVVTLGVDVSKLP
jgi:hypothetical protein